MMIRIVALAALLALPAVPAAAASGFGQPDSFYDVSEADLAGPPGSLIRVLGLPRVQMTTAMAYRILYRSTDMHGRPVAVSAVVVAPNRRPPAGGFPVIAFGHGTTGIARQCAPSLLQNPLEEIPGINQMISGHFVVVATDYQGLGTVGPHPYMVGLSEGRAVLDSVRAVRAMREANAGDRFALWGYSQGGHAVLWAGQLAASYAPELKLVGLAAAAPAAELGRLFLDDESRLSGRILSAMVLESWSKPEVYGAPLSAVVGEDAIPGLKAVAENCIDRYAGDLGDLEANKHLPTPLFKANPTRVRPWAQRVVENVPPAKGIGVPFYIAQGTGDTIVDPQTTVNYVGRLCAAGVPVRLQEFPGLSHDQIAKASGADAVRWIRDRFAGEAAPSTCR